MAVCFPSPWQPASGYMTEKSIEKSAAHAFFRAASDESLRHALLFWVYIRRPATRCSVDRCSVGSRARQGQLRTPDENTGRTASPGPGCRRPAAAAPAPRCLHHACLCATPPRAACAAPASWIASPTHNGASYLPRPPSSLCGASPCDAPMPPHPQSPTPSLHVAAPAPMHHRDVPPWCAGIHTHRPLRSQ